MNLSNARSLIDHSADRLKQLQQEVYSRDLVTIPDHTALGEINKSLVRAYEHLDLAFEASTGKDSAYNETMEYTELVRKRIAAIAEYIRPYRLKHEHVSVYSVLNLIHGEQQAFNHLANLINQIKAVRV